jgi:hypothetical protein
MGAGGIAHDISDNMQSLFEWIVNVLHSVIFIVQKWRTFEQLDLSGSSQEVQFEEKIKVFRTTTYEGDCQCSTTMFIN